MQNLTGQTYLILFLELSYALIYGILAIKLQIFISFGKRQNFYGLTN
jgi:hypothetical protein